MGSEPFQDNAANHASARVAELTERASAAVAENYQYYEPLVKDLAILEGPESELWQKMVEHALEDDKDSFPGRTHKLLTIVSPLVSLGARDKAIEVASLAGTPSVEIMVLSTIAEKEGPESDLWPVIIEKVASIPEPTEDGEAESARDIASNISIAAISFSRLPSDLAIQFYEVAADKMKTNNGTGRLIDGQLLSGNLDAALHITESELERHADKRSIGLTTASRAVKIYTLLGREQDAQTVIDETFPDTKDPRRYVMLAECEAIRSSLAKIASSDTEATVPQVSFDTIVEAAGESDDPHFAIGRIAGVVARTGDFTEARRIYDVAMNGRNHADSDALWDAWEAFFGEAIAAGDYEEAMKWNWYLINDDDETIEADTQTHLALQQVKNDDIQGALERVDTLTAIDDSDLGYTIPNELLGVAAAVIDKTGNLVDGLDVIDKYHREDIRFIYSLKLAANNKLRELRLAA